MALGVGLTGLSRLPAAFATPVSRPSLLSRDEPLGDARGLLATPLTLAPRSVRRFTLVGLHWQGPGTVEFRVRALDGSWSSWQRAVTHELPDPGLEGVASTRWKLGTPVWTGSSNAIQYRLDGRIERLRGHFVRSETLPIRQTAGTSRPSIIRRDGWSADESIVRGEPIYADRLIGAFVHHTAGSPPATPEESAAILRAIQVYHVKSNGWKDIGYNFLVDTFGQVFEGRAGGIQRNVVGAHALGFNTGSVGVAVLGNFEQDDVPAEAFTALDDLLAWRLDVGHVDPLSTVGFVSGGSVSSLRAISGHRDVNSTACPGEKLYEQLDAIALQVSGIGLPKLYEPSVRSEEEAPILFRARLSEPLAWTVTVTDAADARVAAGSGSGVLVEWAWDASQVPGGRYRYAIEAPGVRAATGLVQIGSVSEPPEPPPPPPARPSGLPRRIPRWAWELRAWRLKPKAERGPRPSSAPKRLPAWFWPWFAWQQALAEWKEKYG